MSATALLVSAAAHPTAYSVPSSLCDRESRETPTQLGGRVPCRRR